MRSVILQVTIHCPSSYPMPKDHRYAISRTLISYNLTIQASAHQHCLLIDPIVETLISPPPQAHLSTAPRPPPPTQHPTPSSHRTRNPPLIPHRRRSPEAPIPPLSTRRPGRRDRHHKAPTLSVNTRHQPQRLQPANDIRNSVAVKGCRRLLCVQSEP